MNSSSEPLKIDASTKSAHELNEHLCALPADVEVQLSGCEAVDGLGAGLTHPLSIKVEGDVPDFAWMLAGEVDVDVNGRAGTALGHSLVSGNLLVRGSAGPCVGAFATGGFIAVWGRAGDRCGIGLAGAEVFVRSTVGNEAGHGMRDGVLVLGNGAGEQLGSGLVGGTIFVRGDVASVSSDVRAVRMKDADALRLSLLFARASIKANAAEFTVYRVQSKR